MPASKKPQVIPPVQPVFKPEFVKLGDKIHRGLSIIIYADCGIGKTTLASTLPPDETLIINIEAGIGPLLGKGHHVFYLKRELTELEELYRYLRTEKHPFKFVVIDNISELEQWIIEVLRQGRGKDFPELAEYGDAAAKMREYMHKFRDLVENGVTVVMNAWEMNVDLKNAGGEVVTKTSPKMFRKLVPDVCGIVDMVGRLECWDKTGDRWVRFHPQKNLIAKTQFKGISAEEPANLVEIIEKVYTYDYSKTEAENNGN